VADKKQTGLGRIDQGLFYVLILCHFWASSGPLLAVTAALHCRAEKMALGPFYSCSV